MLITLIVLYMCGAWSSTKSDEKKITVFERKILRKIYSAKRNEEENTHKKTNADMRGMFNEPGIIGIFKTRRLI